MGLAAAGGSSVGQRQVSRPRGPGVSFAAVTVAIVLVIAAVARASHQTPPPTIAEFAPQSVNQIKDQLQNLSSNGGQGGGGSGGASGGDAGQTDQQRNGLNPNTDSSGIGKPRSRRCVRGPDGVLRQTEDPQSPPCVFFWDPTPGNGGQTTKGVDRDEIRIAVPDGDPSVDGQLLKDFETFFNTRYEFYGRQIKLIPTKPDYHTSGDNAQAERDQATDADQLRHVFASLDTEGNTGANYRDELAHRQIIVTAQDPYVGESQMRAAGHHPFIWSYPMDDETMLRMLGEWICKRVAPYPVSATSDPLLLGQPRRIGIIMQEIGSTRFDEAHYLQPVLSQCNAGLVDTYRTSAFFTNPADWTTPMARFKSDTKVTSVICLCWSLDIATSIFPAATGQGYFPEWIFTPYFDLQFANWMKDAPKDQSRNVFGITVLPRDVAFSNDPAVWALKEANPNGYQASGTNDPNSSVNRAAKWDPWYHELLLLASGIQMAGPHLTPQTFEAALHQTVFPNPDHPNMPGKVRFSGGVHSMVMDAAEWWWSNTAPSPYNDSGVQNGAWCYVDGGARYRLGSWPAGQTSAFKGTCDSGG